MADNKGNDGELKISELSDQLKNKYSEERKASEPKIKKAKTMTDDDVKALLRMYYSDRESVPSQKEPSFLIDTSDFVADVDEEEDKPVEKIELEPEIEPETEPEAESEAEPEVEPEAESEAEPEIDLLEEADTETEDAEFAFSIFTYDEEKAEESKNLEALEITEPEIEPEAEPESEPEVEPEAEPEICADENVDESEDDVDEIIYDYSEALEEESVEVLAEDVSENADVSVTEEKVEETEEAVGAVEIAHEDTQVVAEEHFEDLTAEMSSELTLEKEELASVDENVEIESEQNEALESEAVEGETANENETQNSDDSEKIWVHHDDVSGRLDDGELDLMVALGFGDKLTDKYGEERVRRAEAKLRLQKEHNYTEISAFGYIGKEYTKASDVQKIKDKFKRDRKLLTLRCVATLVLSLILLFIDNLELFGISSVLTQNTTLYVLISMLLLVFTAAFSYKQLINGFLFTFERRKNGNAMLSLTFAVILIYDIFIACMAPASVMLFDFTISIGFVFGVLTDAMDFMREKKTFELLTAANKGRLYGLCNNSYEMGGGCVLYAGKIKFAEGYFRRTSRRKHSPFLLFITLVPVALVGAVLAIAMAVLSRSTDVCVGAFVSVFAFASPLCWLFGKSWQSLAVTLQSEEIGGGIIGGRLSDSNVKAKLLDFDDDMAFPHGSCEIMNVIFYENENIYKSLYYVNALFSAVGGPLKPLLAESASNLDLPKSVYLACAAEHYVEATVDGTNLVCAGSYAALKKRGVILDAQSHECPEGCSYMYAAVNNRVCARFLVRYKLSDEFLKLVREIEYEGGGVSIRTLDPNIDRAILLSAFGENTNTVISREMPRELDNESSSVVSVFSRGDIGALAYTYANGKCMVRTERVMDIAQFILICLGAIVSGAMFFFSAPAYCYAAISAIMQLICVLPPIVITSLTKKKNKEKTADTKTK